jgi:hypothetical protein
MSRLSVFATLALFACKPAEEAPDVVVGEQVYALVDIPHLMFTNFDAGDATLMTQLLEDMKLEVGKIDPSVKPKDRAFTIPSLTADQLGGAVMPEGVDPANQVSTVVLGQSTHTVDANAALVVEPNQICIESETTKYAGRTFLTDAACFPARGCDVVRTSQEVRKENLLAKAWYDQFKDFRWFAMADGTPALVARSWVPKVYEGDGGNTSFAQSFTVEAWIPNGETTLRAYAMWAEINIGLPPDVMQNIILDGLGESMTFADQYIDDPTAAWCPNDRNRPYDRPPEGAGDTGTDTASDTATSTP